MDEQDVSLTDALGILPWEGKEGGKRKERKRENIRRGSKNRQDDLLTFSPRPFPGTAPPLIPDQVGNALGTGGLPAVASGQSQAPLSGLRLLMGP